MVSTYTTDLFVVLESVLKAKIVSILSLFSLIFSLESDLLFLRLFPCPLLESHQECAIFFSFVKCTH